LQDVVRGGVWGGIIAGLRIASLSLFSLATANFLAGGAIIGAASWELWVFSIGP